MVNKPRKNETPLKKHKQIRKKLVPPLAQLEGLTKTSWINERMPELLWAVLVIGNTSRRNALDFFRYVAKYVAENKEFAHINLSEIAKQDEEKRRLFISHLLSYSKEIKDILRPLALYDKLPGVEIWRKLLDTPILEEDLKKLSLGVLATLDHQSEKATDCRWIRVLCLMTGGILKFPVKEKEYVRNLFQYPESGDLRVIRPRIRATEIAIAIQGKESFWYKAFWQYNYDNSDCAPEEIYHKGLEESMKKWTKREDRKTEMEKLEDIRNNLINHFFESSKNSDVDIRKEASFGLALYAINITTEIMFYQLHNSVTGRMILRTLSEILITFKYLLKKEKEEPKVWEDFYSYGTGQAKLVYLKLKELNKQTYFIDMERLEGIINEDKWIEFVPINLGHWGNIDLRKMSEYSDSKEIYDLYYNYTSAFNHGTHGAIREATYQRCLNPLHKLHRIPTFYLPSVMPNVLSSAYTLLNEILDSLNQAYPLFEKRI